MSHFYSESQRALQDQFDTRALADRLEAAIIAPGLDEERRAFVESRPFFFLSTVGEDGFPSVSFKGGAPGFVRVPNETTLLFPLYDGNGMFVSAGNAAANNKVGLLFIDYETPNRIRARGTVSLHDSGALADSYPGALLVAEVSIDRVWVNCPRYIPRMQTIAPSPHVPDADGNFEFALWKRIDGMQDVLNAADRARAEELGVIAPEEYARLIQD